MNKESLTHDLLQAVGAYDTVIDNYILYRASLVVFGDSTAIKSADASMNCYLIRAGNHLVSRDALPAEPINARDAYRAIMDTEDYSERRFQQELLIYASKLTLHGPHGTAPWDSVCETLELS